MTAFFDRREFLGAASAGAASLPWLESLPPVSAAEAKLDTKMVQFRPEIEPLVRLIEETPRGRLLEKVAAKIRKGTSYREVLAAMFLAAVRNVEPRPSVGFKFHAVLVVNACHLASINSPDADRWLPIFWNLDFVKAKQLEEERRAGWKLPPVKADRLPKPHKAKQELLTALNNWDEQAADAAVAALVRSAGANEVFEVLFRYACRDFRSIGHKAIFASNAYRALSTIGWQHAEPIVRSLVYAMLNHNGEPNPGKSDLEPDKPFRRNLEALKTVRADWRTGKTDAAVTRDLVSVLHSASSADAASHAVKLLNKGAAPQSLWDAVFLGAGELLMRQPGIIGLHGLTTTNALHYAYATAVDDDTRKLALLQNVAFLPMFRERAKGRGRLRDTKLAEVTPAKVTGKPETVAAILRDISRNRADAAAKVRGYLQAGGDAKALIHAARVQIFRKGRDAHDYKFSSAVLEDFRNVSPAFRDSFLATSVFNLKGSGGRDNPLVERIRGAFGKG